MTRRTIALVALTLLLCATPVLAAASAPTAIEPLPVTAFQTVVVPPALSPTPAYTIVDDGILYRPDPSSRPEHKQPKAKPKVVHKAPAYRAPSRSAVQRYAKARVGAAQYACLYKLWMRESHWRWNASNGSSGAYGIPQALPGRKMASAGADWRTNPITQVRWGLRYIKGRYGTPCRAWSHSQRTGWY